MEEVNATRRVEEEGIRTQARVCYVRMDYKCWYRSRLREQIKERDTIECKKESNRG